MFIKTSTTKKAIVLAALSVSCAVFANGESYGASVPVSNSDVFPKNDSGFVVGLQGGYGNINGADDGFDVAQSGFAGRGYIGYDFNKYFALESGYTYLPDRKYSYIGYDFETYANYAVDLLAKGSIPVTDQFGVFGKLGTVLMGTKTDNENYYSKTTSISLGLGAGVEYKITPNIGVDASWTHYCGAGNENNTPYVPSADVFLLGVSYKFGNRA